MVRKRRGGEDDTPPGFHTAPESCRSLCSIYCSLRMHVRSLFAWHHGSLASDGKKKVKQTRKDNMCMGGWLDKVGRQVGGCVFLASEPL